MKTGSQVRLKALPLEFYARETKLVARELLGKILYRSKNGVVTGGIITETEAYLGTRDSACHTYGGRRTERVASMYKNGGHAYVYFIYGMHFCFNVVTRDETKPEAVLIRALEPMEGSGVMRRRRGFSEGKPDRDLCSGPAKLCEAMAIDRSIDGLSLIGRTIWISEGSFQARPASKIVISKRVGVDYALRPAGRPARDWPLRFRLGPGML